MTWQAIIREAASVSRSAAQRLPELVELVEVAARGECEELHVVAVYDADLWKVPFLEALAEELPSVCRSLSPKRLAAVRAVLLVMPGLLDSLRTIIVGELVSRERVGEALKALEVAAQLLDANESAEKGQRCPRCGSPRISSSYTGMFSQRVWELRCNACGHYLTWQDD